MTDREEGSESRGTGGHSGSPGDSSFSETPLARSEKGWRVVYSGPGYRWWPLIIVVLMMSIIGGMVGTALVPMVFPDYLDRMLPGPSIPAPNPGGRGAGPPEATSVVTQVAESVSPAVVGVINKAYVLDWLGRRHVKEGGGSGVIFDRRGYVVTNYHVVEGADELLVALADGRQVDVTVVGVDPRTDLAVVKVKGEDFPVAAFGDSDQIRVGELAIAIGNPFSLEFERTITTGVVSGIRNIMYGAEDATVRGRIFRVIQTDAAINPGNSGGPLVNAAGEVIGINSFKIAQPPFENLGFAIPINDVRRVLDDLVRYGRVRRAMIGISFAPKETVEQFKGIKLEKGVFVAEVDPSGPAGRAGIKAEDVIIEFKGQEVNNYVDLLQMIEYSQPGERVNLTINRGNRVLNFSIILGELPEDR